MGSKRAFLRHARKGPKLCSRQTVGPVPQRAGRMVFSGDPGIPKALVPTRWHNMAPRIGLAYSPGFSGVVLGKIFGGPGHTGIRASYGIFYTAIDDFTQFYEVGDAPEPLAATAENDGAKLTGSFGVFYPGRLIARFYSSSGVPLGTAPIMGVSPLQLVSLHQTVIAPPGSARISLHLVDKSGSDKGSLGEVPISGVPGNRW